MPFEKEFPSLESKQLEDSKVEDDDEFTGDMFVWVSDVEKYCLDKTRVKEAIEKLLKKAELYNCPADFRTDESNGRIYALCELEKELGL